MKSDEIMDVALRRGFIFPSSEIYGGFSGFMIMDILALL